MHAARFAATNTAEALVVINLRAPWDSPDVRFGSKADMCSALGDVRFVPKADVCGARTMSSMSQKLI